MDDNSGKVTVYNVQKFDIVQGKNILSSRMATKSGADLMRGEILRETETIISADDLERGEQWTPCDYKPRK